MQAKKPLVSLFLVLMALVVALSACAPAAAPTPTAVPPTATLAPKPAATATPVAVALDMKTALDKYFSALPDGFGTIAPAALNDQLAVAKPFLLDLREPKEITDNGTIAGSVNVPTRTLIKSLDKLPAKDQPIVSYCGIGHRGAMGMMALGLLGYTNVKSIAGGFGAWKTAKLPVVK